MHDSPEIKELQLQDLRRHHIDTMNDDKSAIEGIHLANKDD